MTEQIKYTCKHCGQEHYEWPALGFNSPENYDDLPEADKETLAEIDNDFCIIRYPDQTDRFIRCTLKQKVIDHCEDLEYGVWVSVSEKSFTDYSDNYNNEQHEVTYFGWLCNTIPGYTFNESIPMTVFTQPENLRPLVVPHEETDHPFVKDYYTGISKQEAEERIREAMGIPD